MTIQKQLNERDHLISKVEFAETEAAKRLKEMDAKEAERIEAQNQFKRILGMVEDRVNFLEKRAKMLTIIIHM